MRQRSLAVILGFILFASSLGCSLVSNLANSESEASKPDLTPPPNPNVEWQANQLDFGLTALRSYQAELTIHFTGKDEQDQPASVKIEFLHVIDTAKQARHIFEKVDSGSEMALIDSNLYDFGLDTYNITDINGNLGCDKVTNSADNPQSIRTYMMMISQIMRGPLVKKGETVGGILTDHYQVAEVKFDTGQVDSQTGDVWVAEEGGYIVRSTGAAQGKLNLGKAMTGKAEWDYSLTKINQAAVTLDPACNGLDFSEVPLPKDAQVDRTSSEELYYTSPSSLKTLGDFYRKELAAGGWKIGDEHEDDANILFTASRGGEQLTIAIDASGGECVVSIWRKKQ